MFTRNSFLLHICTSSVCFMSLDGFSFSIVLHLPSSYGWNGHSTTRRQSTNDDEKKIHNPLTSCITFIDFHFSCFVPVSSPMNPLLETQSFLPPFGSRLATSTIECDKNVLCNVLFGRRENFHPPGGIESGSDTVY
jgi:hypothetical protein